MADSNKRRLSIIFSGLLIINDFLVVFIAFVLSYWFRFYSAIFPTPLGIPSYRDYFFPLLFIEILLIVLINANGLYKPEPGRRFIDQSFALFKSICLAMLFVLAGTFFYRGKSYSRSLILILWVSLGIFLVLSRYLWLIFYQKRVLPRIKKSIILVGRPESLKNFLSKGKGFLNYGNLIGTIFTRKLNEPEIEFPPCLGTLDEFEEIVEKNKPEEVVLTDLEIPRRKIISLILESEKRLIAFKIVADLLDVMIQQFELENIDGINLIKIKESPLNYAYNRFLKRSMDILGSAIVLILLLPLFLIIAILIKLDSAGPLFFSQERVGEWGKVFRIYKFRTMRHNAEAETGPVFARKDDERCTRIGKFLRRYNLDELPQLFNVLKGDMSLVGPRPERPYFVSQFKNDVPRYMSRHYVKSGITGWAQVNGLRQNTPIDERIKYDLYYLENWSLWFDIKIILLTLFAFKNAY